MAVDIVPEARSWVGTPFRHQGRLKGIGVDCVGFFLGVYTAVLDASRLPPDRTDYGRETTGNLEHHLEKIAYRVPKSQMTANDVLVIKFDKARSHVAICAGDTMIHAYSLARKVTEHRINNWWTNKIASVWRLHE